MEARYKRYHILTKCHRCVSILTTLLWFTSAVSLAETTTTLQEGVEYVKLRLYPQAADAFKSILSQQPTNVDALFQLGNVYKLQDDLELAIETFNKIFPAVADLKKCVGKGEDLRINAPRAGGNLLQTEPIRHRGTARKRSRAERSNRCRYTLPTRLYLHTSGEIRRGTRCI